jgi:putative phosphoesterase
MKLAFISDIHGNAIALDAVLKDIKQKEIDQIFVLGDIAYRGPEPQRSVDLVRALNVDVIKGNADEWVVRGVREEEVPEAVHSAMNEERDWTVFNLNDESVEYLKNLPTELKLEFDSIHIHAFHATPTSLFDVVQPDESNETLQEKLMQHQADIFIYGHIHKPFVRFIDGKCVINTGSVGLPFDGLNKSAYALVEIGENDFQASIVRVDYDVNDAIKQFRESDYPNKEFMTNLFENAGV